MFSRPGLTYFEMVLEKRCSRLSLIRVLVVLVGELKMHAVVKWQAALQGVKLQCHNCEKGGALSLGLVNCYAKSHSDPNFNGV